MQVTGIILAGGQSSRMGRDKGLIDFRGKRLVEYPLDLLGKFCDQLIISSDNPDYKQFGVTVAPDLTKGKGPLTGICSAMSLSSGQWNMVVGCDMPFLEAELIERLLVNPLKGVVPVHQHYMEPLAAVYNHFLLSFFEEARMEENLSLKSILPVSGVSFLPVDDLLEKFPLMFYNINSPADLERFSISNM